MLANASHHNNLDFERLAKKILAEAERIDSEEDELYGDARGDELPEQLRTSGGRRAALKEAKAKLDAEREAISETGTGTDTESAVGLRLDPEVIVARVQGREGWLREASRQLDRHRGLEAKPIPREERFPLA